MIRYLSWSEISTALRCEAQHAFRYTGRLSDGAALKRKLTHPMLRDGKAWGRGVAVWQEHGRLRTDGLALAHEAIDKALAEDAAEQEAFGVYDPDEHRATAVELHLMLDHYAATSKPLILTDPELAIDVPIPSRTGRRRSSRYRFVCFVDGFARDVHGRLWIVENKLRSTLSTFEVVEKDRQVRWEAWAAREQVGLDVYGVLVEERWKRAPRPPKLVQSAGKKIVRIRDDGKPDKDYIRVPSHDQHQMCTPDAYRLLCAEHGVEPSPQTEAELEARKWQERHPIVFRRGELDEAGVELVSAARKVQELDPGGSRYPLRNPGQMNCPSCAFREVCADPAGSGVVIDLDFERRAPKRDRRDEEVAA